MPKLVTSKKTAARNAAAEGEKLAQIAEAQRQPTLDELREKHALGTVGRVDIEAREYRKLAAIAKEHSNAANRQKTQIKNAVKSLAREEDLKPEDVILVEDDEYRYDVTNTEKVNIDKLFGLYTAKKITLDQLKASVSVVKSEAERVIGPHVINSITDKVKGKTLDIRVSAAKTPIDGVLIKRHVPKATEVEITQEAVKPVAQGSKSKRAGKLVIKRKLRL